MTYVHHVAIRVGNLERAGQFYVDAFEARWRTKPFIQQGPDAEVQLGGPPGTKWKQAYIEIGGVLIELYEFLEPLRPVEALASYESKLVQLALGVDDLEESIARVERAGGKCLWPRTYGLEDLNTMLVADLDHTVLELLDRDAERMISLLLNMMPEHRPDDSATATATQ